MQVAHPVIGPFKPTHTSNVSGRPIQVLLDPVYKQHSLVPGLVARDENGWCYFILEEEFTKMDKKGKVYINYTPVDHA